MDDRSAVAEMTKDNMSRSKGCVSAQIQFNRWGEPAEIEKRIALNDKSGLGQVVLRSDGLEERVRKQIC